MTTKQSQKIYLKDYTKPDFEVESVVLNFDLHEDFCRVVATSKFKAVNPGKPLHLEGVDLELLSLSLNGEALSPSQYTKTDDSLEIAKVPAIFELKIETKIFPQKNTSLEGLYRSNETCCTQCEAQGFRKITYFMDRPDVMTKYAVTIEADK